MIPPAIANINMTANKEAPKDWLFNIIQLLVKILNMDIINALYFLVGKNMTSFSTKKKSAYGYTFVYY